MGNSGQVLKYKTYCRCRSYQACTGVILCFFHAIRDLDPVINNDPKQKDADWSNYCGTSNFTEDDIEETWNNVTRNIPYPDMDAHVLGSLEPKPPPNRVFLIHTSEDSPTRPNKVVFAWPPPRMAMPSEDGPRIIEQAPRMDGKYWVEDYADLMRQVQLENKTGREDAWGVAGKTSCTRRFQGGHIMTNEGLWRKVESIFIPYGNITFACFQTVEAAPLAQQEGHSASRIPLHLGTGYPSIGAPPPGPPLHTMGGHDPWMPLNGHTMWAAPPHPRQQQQPPMMMGGRGVYPSSQALPPPIWNEAAFSRHAAVSHPPPSTISGYIPPRFSLPPLTGLPTTSGFIDHIPRTTIPRGTSSIPPPSYSRKNLPPGASPVLTGGVPNPKLTGPPGARKPHRAWPGRQPPTAHHRKFDPAKAKPVGNQVKAGSPASGADGESGPSSRSNAALSLKRLSFDADGSELDELDLIEGEGEEDEVLSDHHQRHQAQSSSIEGPRSKRLKALNGRAIDASPLQVLRAQTKKALAQGSTKNPGGGSKPKSGGSKKKGEEVKVQERLMIAPPEGIPCCINCQRVES